MVILSPRLLSMLRFGTILLKNVLNVSSSSSLFVIVLLLSFNVMHSLWKAFSEKRELIVFQTFLLSVAILSFRNSLSYFYAKYSHRDFFVYYRDFLLRSFFRVNIFRSFDLSIMVFLGFLVTKLELFARMNFLFFWSMLVKY